jgi:hypothetical protein
MTLATVSVDPSRITTALAYDLASNLMGPEDLMAKYELSPDEFKIIVSSTEFRQLYREAKVAWESDPKARVEAKAQAAVEDGLLPVHAILHSGDYPPAARLEAFKQLKEVARLGGSRKADDMGGGRVSITINVPGQQAPAIIAGEVAASSTDAESTDY